ncbi:MAG: ATP-binding protein [Comamonadaceae bacterium]|nr:MAG: ATP-binding protein [Comamonadaceae bacterium]
MAEQVVELQAVLAQVAPTTQHVRGLLPGWLTEAERDAVELAVTEALTNIIEHGYGGDRPEPVRLRVRDDDAGLAIDIWDRGRPIPDGLIEATDVATTFLFDPTDVDGLPEGGMGLALIKAAFDDVRYGSRDGVNRLHLLRRL